MRYTISADYWVFVKTKEDQSISSNWTFTKPVTGIPAINNNQFITLGQANDLYSGSGSGSTGTNGLNGTTNIGLGGTLTEDTTINIGVHELFINTGTGTFFDISPPNIFFQSDSYTAYSSIPAEIDIQAGDNTGVQGLLLLTNGLAKLQFTNVNGNISYLILNSNDSTFVDSINNKGIVEAGDYSANKTALSYVTKKMLGGGTPVAFALKPSSPTIGQQQNFTDSTTITWGATITGTGTNQVLGRWNGTNWTVVGI